MMIGAWLYGVGLVAGMGMAQSSSWLPSMRLIVLIVPLLMLFPWTLRACPARALAAFPFLWVGPSKLLLLSWGAGLDHLPLHLAPSDSLSRRRSYGHGIRSFLYVAVLPILPVRVTGCSSPSSSSSSSSSSSCSTIFKAASQSVAFLAILYLHARHRHRLPACLLQGLYSLLIYLGIDLVFGAFASLLSLLFDVRCQPPSHNPLMSASLSEFWGKRWNLLVSAMLRSTVYDPVLHYLDTRPRKPRPICTSNGGSPDLDIDEHTVQNHDLDGIDKHIVSDTILDKEKKSSLQARCLALMATFLVSGLFHELIFFCIHNGRQASGETTAFFLVHGLATMAEVCLRRWIRSRMRLLLPRPLCVAFTLSFLYVTAVWLFMPPLTNAVCPSDFLR